MSAESLPLADEPARLAALAALGWPGDATPAPAPAAAGPDDDFVDRALRELVAEAAAVCDAPLALLTLLHGDHPRVWIKHGELPSPTHEVPRHATFCANTLAAGPHGLVVPSAPEDSRFASHPWVAGAPFLRFHAGVPVVMPAVDGAAPAPGPTVAIGTLAVFDTRVRRLEPASRERLLRLAALAGALLDERRRRLALARDLRASEARYRAMVEEQTDVVAVVDPRGRLRYANAAFASLFGRAPETLPGLPWADLLDDAEARALHGQLRLARERGEPVMGETRVRDERWIEWTHRPVAPAAGPADRIVGGGGDDPAANDDGIVHSVGRDVTERKRLERELFVSETRYRSLFDHMQAGFALHEIVQDAQGRVVDLRYLAVNAAHARMMGFDESRMQGATLGELFPRRRGRESGYWLRTFARVALSGETLRFERHSPHYDRWYDVIAYRPAPGQFATIVEDITERKRAQQEIQAQHERLRVTLHSIGDAVITTDDGGRVQYLNPVAERLTGWSDTDARGRPLDEVFQIVDEHSREPLPDPVARCLAQAATPGGGPASLPGVAPATLIHRLGTEAGIEESVAPICGADGRVMGAVLVFRDVTEQRRMAREMSYRATHDALTGLVNRSDFEARLAHTLRLAHADDSVHALMYIDLDQFKLVNDACGHGAGDQLLRQVSGLLKQCVRSRDTLARLGGDEFGVILEFCAIEQAQRVAEQICARMDEYRFVQDERRFRVGTSIGLVPLDRRWPDTQSLLQAADAACYAAKEAGRNRVHAWFDADHHLRLRHGEMQWVTRLEQALDDDRFELFGQRITPLTAKDPGLHVEVLLRLRDLDGVIVAPGAFLPAAERFHLVSRVDRWVVAQVVRWMARHRERLSGVATIAVNLSGQSIGDAAFLRYVKEVIAGTAFDAGKLCFEITETAAITNMVEAKSFIRAMQAHGIRFALDDFGAGASGFGYLKTLPVDYLKIDGQFVRDLIEDPLDRAAVRCFREVAAAVGTQTIAEFVETPATATALAELGIDFGQGYLWHRPEPLDAAVGLVPSSSSIL